MTDNFDLFREYIKKAGIPDSKNYLNDKFFLVELIRRGKDCPNLPAANYTFKIYYVDSIEEYDRAREEIEILCKNFPLRAYISVNCKSKIKSLKKTLLKIASAIDMNESKKPWRLFNASCNEIENKEDKRWVVDIDTKSQYTIDLIKNIIQECESKYSKNDVFIETVNTKSGIHLITRPFNTYQFDKKIEEINKNRQEAIKNIDDNSVDLTIEKPEVKKNHLTLLYEDLETPKD